MPDLALLITMALTADHSLTGPRPTQVLDPVPHSDLVRAGTAGIPELLDNANSPERSDGWRQQRCPRRCHAITTGSF
jgi:hypothetical protein